MAYTDKNLLDFLTQPFEGMNVFGARPSEITRLMAKPTTQGGYGLLSDEMLQRADRQSLGKGLLTTLASYLAQPKNQGYGSALPYLASSYLQGMGAADKEYKDLEQQAYTQMKLADYTRQQTDLANAKKSVADFVAKNEGYNFLLTLPPNQALPIIGTIIGNQSKVNPPTLDEMAFKNEFARLDEENKLLPPEQQLSKSQLQSRAYKNVKESGRAPMSQKDKILETMGPLEQKLQLHKLDPNNNPGLTKKEQAELDASKTLLTYISNDPTGAAGLTQPQEKGQIESNKEYAKRVTEWNIDGKQQNQVLLTNLKQAKEILEKGKYTTGPIVGQLPKGIQAYATPQAIEIDDLIKQVAQLDLRRVLGAQFGEKEGQQMLDRALNPLLPPEVNLQRVNKLINALEQNAKTLDAATEYFNNNNGSMVGFKGKFMSANELLDEIGPSPLLEKGKQEVTFEMLQKRFPNMSVEDLITIQESLR